MLAKHLRLRRSDDFQTVRRHGKRWRGRLLTLNVLSNSLSHNRYGIIVSRKVGKAVTRNRVKRRLRALLQQQWSGKLAAGYDIVIVAHPQTGTVSFGRLRDELGQLFDRADLTTEVVDEGQ